MLMSFYNLRQLLSWGLMIAAMIGVIYIGYMQNHESNILRLASGARHTYLHAVGMELKSAVEKYTDYKVELVVSKDSSFNRGLLQSGRADIAILSPATSEMSNLAAVAPIAENYVQVIVRRDRGINAISELSGRAIALGGSETDHRKNALKLLNYYHVEEKILRHNQQSYMTLLEKPELDGAIVTTSTRDPYVRKLMATGNFKLLPIEAYEGLASVYAHLHFKLMPNGSFPSVDGPLPTDWLPMVTTASILTARVDAPDAVIEALLRVLFTKEMHANYPLLTEWVEKTGGQWPTLTSHGAAERYFNPYQSLEKAFFIFMLKLWNYKLLLLCLLVLAITGMSRLSHYHKTKEATELDNKHRRIQKLIEDINQHEQLQADTKDYRLLMRRLSEARKIKQDGILVATEQGMTDTQVFAAFLHQCDHVIKEIQWKLSAGMAVAEAG